MRAPICGKASSSCRRRGAKPREPADDDGPMSMQPQSQVEPGAAPDREAKRYQVADRAPRGLADLVLRWETILLVLLAAVIIGNTLVSTYFLDLYNLADATYNFSEKAIIALAMALLIL